MSVTMSLCCLSMVFILSMLRSGSGAGMSPQDIYILAGQSNMVGHGGVKDGKWDKVVPPECNPNPGILSLTAQLEWTQAKEPLHADLYKSTACGIGPGMPFANKVKTQSPAVIGLVPCAEGGTKISDWTKGTKLYNQMVGRAQAAIKGGGVIRAVLWYQGESDTNIQADAEAYKGNMETLIKNLQADLNGQSYIFLQVALASGRQFVETVRAAQLGISLPNVRTVDAKGLDLNDDHIHLTTASQVKLGTMLAEAFFQ